jgi:immune inhibitor A
LLKKILISAGITMAMLVGTLGMNCTPVSAAQNSTVKANGINMVKPYDLDKTIDLLKKNGKIPENATEAEIQAILQKYLNEDYQEMTKEEKQMKATQKQMLKSFVEVQTAKQKGLKSESVSIGKIDNVQPKAWKGVKRAEKVLTLLIQFPDYNHNQMKPGMSAMYYKDFNKQHFMDVMFGENGYARPEGVAGNNFLSMKNFYEQQSGGSFTFNGGVTDWMTASKPAEFYGQNVVDADGNVTSHNKGAANLVYEALMKAVADGLNLADYDLNKDGVPDHLAVIYAGMGEEEGGGDLGENAMWSHSSGFYAPTAIGTIPKGTPVFYVMMPENAAAGVCAHEFGHQLGLRDEYDTKYTGNGDAVSDWSIMSGGSWGGIVPGTEPTGFSPYAKEFFAATMPGSNWTNSKVVDYNSLTAGSILDFKLDQASSKGLNNSYIRINLPDKKVSINTPTSGLYAYFGGKGTDGAPLKTSMSAKIDLTLNTKASLEFKTWYDIEKYWDFASIQVKEQTSDTWIALKNNLTTDKKAEGAEITTENGITGSSKGEWVDAIFDLSAFAGKKIDVKFVYEADSYTYGEGFYVDDIRVLADAKQILFDDVEGTPALTLAGFVKTDCKASYTNCYFIEWRNHQGVDMGLKHNVIGTKGSMVEYDPGMVVWYNDNSFTDNWTGVHPGEGFLGVVDADQGASYYKYINSAIPDIAVSSEIQIHDAAFSLRKSLPMLIDRTDSPAGARISVDNDIYMNPVFDDSRSYFTTELSKEYSHAGRIIPNLGIKIFVTGESRDRSVGTIKIVKTK